MDYNNHWTPCLNGDDEPARRVHRFKHGESVQQYGNEFGFNFITLLRTKKCRNGVKLVYDVDGR